VVCVEGGRGRKGDFSIYRGRERKGGHEEVENQRRFEEKERKSQRLSCISLKGGKGSSMKRERGEKVPLVLLCR